MSGLDDRRKELLQWVIADLGWREDELADREADPNLIRGWALNHARLVLGQDLDRAVAWFENFALDDRPKVWGDGIPDTTDWDFPATNVLRTLLDFADSPRLPGRARERLTRVFTEWDQPRKSQNRDNDHVHRYPAIHTENHDIMCLTIGLFGQVLGGRDASAHVAQLRESLSMRFRRGWTEWHSPVYQVHYLNPLLILADHAPDAALRKSAEALVNVQLAERAALSVGGYLGGPFQRGYDNQHASDRVDNFLSVMWQAFGLCDRDDALGEKGVHFAASRFRPHPVVAELATLPSRTPVACHRGTRDCSRQKRELPRRTICYWNTPHVSMGSMNIVGRAHQARFFNVLFAADPAQSLRTHLHDPEQTSPWEPRREMGAVVQHENWLIARGRLVEQGGLSPEPAGGFNLYRVGSGLCAHNALADDLHVFQAGDLDLHADERAFLSTLSMPRLEGGVVHARSAEGCELRVELADMALTVAGRPGHDWSDKLHAGPWLDADWDAGAVKVTTGDRSATFSAAVEDAAADKSVGAC